MPIMHRPRVTFSETSEMVLVTDLSQNVELKQNLWYTSHELESFKSKLRSYIELVRLHTSKGQAPTASAILGLDKFLTLELTSEYKLRRDQLFKHVLEEDAWHRSANCAHVPQDMMAERLACISAEKSHWARTKAYWVAVFLEQDQQTEQFARYEASIAVQSELPRKSRRRRRHSLTNCQAPQRVTATKAEYRRVPGF